MIKKNKEKINSIAIKAQLAGILEVSAKKPGNVSPQHDFLDTGYEDFLAGSLAIGEGIRESAKRGLLAGTKKISRAEIKIGELIKKCIIDVKSSHSGGNSHLGMVMLMVPLSAAAGTCLSQNSFKNLRKNAVKVMGNSTLEDSLNFYDAVKISQAGGFKEKLTKPEIPFHELMKISAKKDKIAEELAHGFNLSFFSAQLLEKNFIKTKKIREAILQSYLQLLAKYPDTLIAKKVGKRKAQEISKRAEEIIGLGGVFSKKGKKEIKKFGVELGDKKNKLNPGTTADIIASSILIFLLRKNMFN